MIKYIKLHRETFADLDDTIVSLADIGFLEYRRKVDKRTPGNERSFYISKYRIEGE